MKIKTTLVVIFALLLVFTTLVWLMGWFFTIVGLILNLAIVATIYWVEPIKKIIGKIRDFFKPTTPPAPASLNSEFGVQWNKLQSLLACLAGIAMVLGILTALLLFLIGSFSPGFQVGNKMYTVNWLPFPIILAVLYIIGSFQTVREDENAVKVAFGYMFEDVGPGLTFVPRWVCKLIRVTSKVITLAGGTPEKVKALERGDNLAVEATDQFKQARLVQNDTELCQTPGGTIRVSEEATRVTFAERKTAKYFRADKAIFEGKTTNPLGSQFTTDPKIVMGLLIPKEGIRMLVRRFGTPFGALREIDELMTSHMQVLCSRITTEYFIFRVDDIALILQLILETLLGDTASIISSPTSHTRLLECLTDLEIRLDTIQTLGKTGVDIKSLRLETGLPKGINLSLKGVVEADIKIQTAEKEGEAVRIRAQKAGAGAASATEADLLAKAAGRDAMLNAEASGRKAIIKASDSPYGRFLAQLEAMQAAMANNSKVIISPGGGDILGAFTNIKETLKQLEEADAKKLSPTPPPTT